MTDLSLDRLAKAVCPLLDEQGSVSVEEMMTAHASLDHVSHPYKRWTYQQAIPVLRWQLCPTRGEVPPLMDGRYDGESSRWPHLASEAFFETYRDCPPGALSDKQARACIAHPVQHCSPEVGAVGEEELAELAYGGEYGGAAWGLRLPVQAAGSRDKIAQAALRACQRQAMKNREHFYGHLESFVEQGLMSVEEAQDHAETTGHPLLFPEERARRLSKN